MFDTKHRKSVKFNNSPDSDSWLVTDIQPYAERNPIIICPWTTAVKVRQEAELILILREDFFGSRVN